MNDLYWITVLGNLSTMTSVISFCSACLFTVAIIAYVTAYCEDYNNSQILKWKKVLISFLFTTILFGSISCFTPTTKELYMIYGVGGTIDYLKENPKTQEIPDKCINAIDKWLDMQLQEEAQNNE